MKFTKRETSIHSQQEKSRWGQDNAAVFIQGHPKRSVEDSFDPISSKRKFQQRKYFFLCLFQGTQWINTAVLIWHISLHYFKNVWIKFNHIFLQSAKGQMKRNMFSLIKWRQGDFYLNVLSLHFYTLTCVLW